VSAREDLKGKTFDEVITYICNQSASDLAQDIMELLMGENWRETTEMSEEMRKVFCEAYEQRSGLKDSFVHEALVELQCSILDVELVEEVRDFGIRWFIRKKLEAK
jgi:hypothetical protein